MSRVWFWLVLMVLSSQVSAVVDVYEFESEVDRKRYQSFVEELRCPKCQNQNLSGSNSPIASDLRREVYRLIVAGQSDKEIIDHMVSRYGEFVLYRPRMQGSTWALWLAPVALLLVALVAVLLIARRRSLVAGGAPTDIEMSKEQRQQLDRLLAQTKSIEPAKQDEDSRA